MTLLGLIPPGLILWLEAHGHWAATILTIVLSGFCAAHAALHKRDARSAIGWIGLILLVPVLGSVLYVLLGINRVRRRAAALMRVSIPATREALPGAPLWERLRNASARLLSPYL